MDFDIMESEYVFFEVPAMESLENTPFSEIYKTVNPSIVSGMLSVYDNTDSLPYYESVLTIHQKYINSDMMKAVDKAFDKVSPKLIDQQVKEMNNFLTTMKDLLRINLIITKKMAKKNKGYYTTADNAMDKSLENIKKIRKDCIKEIVEKIFTYKNNFGYENDIPDEELEQYIACKFTLINYDKKIYDVLRQIGFVAQAAKRKWSEDMKNGFIDLLRFSRFQYVDTVEACCINYIKKFQLNDWIEDYLTDKIPSMI